MDGICDQISGKVMSVKILRLTFENNIVIFVGKKIKSKCTRPAIRM